MSHLLKAELPEELITSVDVFRTYREDQLDVRVTFNVFGEVLGVENDYFDLPEAAKKLTYGVDPPPEIKALKTFVKELKILIPMMAMDLKGKSLLPAFLVPVEEKLKNLKTKAKSGSAYVPNDYIKDEWTKALYDAKQTDKYPLFFDFFIKEEKILDRKFDKLFISLSEFQHKQLRDDLKEGKEYANVFFVFSVLQMADPNAIHRITKQLDLEASNMMIDISSILNKEIFMEKRFERDVIQKLMGLVNMDKIKDTFLKTYVHGFENKFKVTDPVLKGMLATFIYKAKGGADLRKSKNTFTNVFKDFFDNFKPY